MPTKKLKEHAIDSDRKLREHRIDSDRKLREHTVDAQRKIQEKRHDAKRSMIETAMKPQYVGDKVIEEGGGWFSASKTTRDPIYKTANDQIKKLLEKPEEEFLIENEHLSKRRTKDEFWISHFDVLVIP